MQLIIYFFNCCFTVGPKIFCQAIGILIESDPFMPIFFYESKWMNESKKSDLRKLCNIIGLTLSMKVGNLKAVILISVLRNYSAR